MMPRNRSTSDSRKPLLQDQEYYLKLLDENEAICIADVKHWFRFKSDEAFRDDKNEKLAIFLQTLSLSLSCSHFHTSSDSEDIQSYIAKVYKELEIRNEGGKKKIPEEEGSNEKDFKKREMEKAKKYLENEVILTCRTKIPKEWTVIQLSKKCHPHTIFSKFEDIMTYNSGLSMTIFKHSAIQEMVMVDIQKSTALDNVFEKVFKLNKMITDSAQQNIAHIKGQGLNDKEVRERYLKATQEIDVFVQDIVNNLTSFLGPWISALTGNFKSRKSIMTENEIRKKVMEFLSTRSYFTDYQQKLIHLIARRVDLLSHQQIFVAITYILEDKPNLGYEDIDLNDLYDHLTWIKQEYKYDDTSTHPCILILDELLDQLPFEMVNTQQEFTRICSFSNLKRLCESYQGSFDINGYIITPAKTCHGIVNPEKNLLSMEERMKKFFNYWLPSWKINYQNEPRVNFSEVLSQSDVFVYCGHGSGLHALSDNIYSLKTSSVVFLFGCASTGLQSTGLHSELTGAHQYYHLGYSPCVIGFLWTVSDFPTDLCSTRILSGWISSNAKPHWQLIDKNLWRKHGQLNFSRVCEVISSSNLPEIIARMRSDMELPIALRASLVYRGLPVTTVK